MVSDNQHNLVPDHTVLEKGAIDSVLQEYDIKKTDLPKIKVDDPALPDSAEVGNVVEITRDSRTADQATVYRLVVK
jgi:DNA-directed RNA polymerase subunit H